MTPDQMLAKAQLVLNDDRALRPVPRAALAAAWAVLAAATAYVRSKETPRG